MGTFQVNWDCIILDEYHYGAWRDTAKDLYEEERSAKSDIIGNGTEYWDEEISPLRHLIIYLSGTPFKAIESGEFIEEQIYNWTYTDEHLQKKIGRGEKSL